MPETRTVPREELSYSGLMAKMEEWRHTMLPGHQSPRFLFRGHTAPCFDKETRVEVISPRYARFPTPEEVKAGARDDVALDASATLAIGHAFTVFNWSQFFEGMAGYRYRHRLDTTAILQHYGFPTHLIDFTGTPEVALFFAFLTDDDAPPPEPTLYVLDRLAHAVADEREGSIHVVDHDFLAFPGKEGLRVRWPRQDGFGVTSKDWRSSPATRSLNLAAVPGLLRAYPLDPRFRERALKGLLDLDGDPVAEWIRQNLPSAVSQLLQGEAHPAVEARVAKMPC